MLDLDDKRWGKLQHAYGEASDIPKLLRQLRGFPPYTDYRSEPYFSLWSALCHQGDVYTASYAALPHIVSILRSAPLRAHWSPVLLVAAIEIARAMGHGPEIEEEFEVEYSTALESVPEVIAAMSAQPWDELTVRACAAALAAAKRQPSLAEAILELEPNRLENFMSWIAEQ